ncbi:hypothetical protein DP117_02025 [Brasilonema sp. UFV-L1]|uniref:hypothetical protein n=1 Tax=Brasilonema sp. UFV-L1 TaxID=2234130 RepID=UPI0016A326A0|nr:hypothetical protein [Brasilonema sp. UFV-L1]
MSSRKGKKAVRGVPLFYDEKKRVHGITLTNFVWEGLTALAHQQQISVSELIERWARTEIDKNSNSPSSG